MKKQIFLVSIILLFNITIMGVAQNFPAVLIKDENSDQHKPLRLFSLSIDVKVVANLATTTMSMTFYNDLSRILEGELYFPLGEGQTVSRFAMDVNGKLREGVVVEKAKGRQVFESIVRQGIDPGLLEWTKGNKFKSRVYPIPPKGYKKIVIAYEQQLLDTDDGFLYTLPLNFKDKVDEFSIRVEVFKQTITPDLSKNKLQNLHFRKWRESYLAETEFKNFLPNRQLVFALPKEESRQRIFVEEDKNGENYFFINIEPDLKNKTKELPKTVALFWDVSASAAGKEIDKELAVLNSYFKKIGDLKIELVVFSNEVHEKEIFELRDGNSTLLFYKIKNLAYDGGTQLGALNLNDYTCDEVIISSDGISNFGKEEIILSQVPVIVLNSCLSAEHAYLKYITQRTAGVYLNLNTLTIDQALMLLISQTYVFISAEYADDEITETYPSISSVVQKDFSISGKLKSHKAQIVLNFGFGNKIHDSKTIILDKEKYFSESGMVKRMWGQKKIAELDMLFEKNEEEITTLGKELSIVTRNTSLIVLDRLEDYLQHRITPPEELQKEYFAQLTKMKEQKEQTEKEHIEKVIEMFQKRLAWWNTEFPMDDPVITKDKITEADLDESPRARRQAARHQMEEEVSGTGILGVLSAAGEGSEEFENLDDVLSGIGGLQSVSPSTRRGGRADQNDIGGDQAISEGTITLTKWDPATPYLKAMKGVADEQLYTSYLEHKNDYGNSSAFFLDMSDFFLDKNKPELSLRILSNIAEMELENHQLLRILGHRLNQIGQHELSLFIFEEVLEIREEEPQSYRDLGLTYAANGRFQESIDMLYTVVKKSWDNRFPEIELIVLNELNSIVASSKKVLDLSNIDNRLLKNLPVDIRVVLNWDADNTDMDLWITDPNNEKCIYDNPDTYLGGHLSRDFTGGYGPEEFILKKAKSGKYTVQVDYYGNQQQTISGATTVQVELILNYGKTDEQRKAITLRLKDVKEVVDIAEFEFKPGDINTFADMKIDSRAKSAAIMISHYGKGPMSFYSDGRILLGLILLISLIIFSLYQLFIKKIRRQSK
jgi:tetratricopeptide (TPR) repeat protein